MFGFSWDGHQEFVGMLKKYHQEFVGVIYGRTLMSLTFFQTFKVFK
jgi:hypothetical protein